MADYWLALEVRLVAVQSRRPRLNLRCSVIARASLPLVRWRIGSEGLQRRSAR